MGAADRPRILCCSGLDPSGGAGLQADILSAQANGGHALPVATALTVQDTRDAQQVEPVSAELIDAQLRALADDGPIAAIKVGLIGHVEQIAVLIAWIERLAVPVVVDPVLRAGGGTPLVGEALAEALRDRLLPLALVATPNLDEARQLAAPAEQLADIAPRLLAIGCRHWLITGGDQPGDTVLHHWVCAGAEPTSEPGPRLPGAFRGAGCTLAASLATRLALGDSPTQAHRAARAYTHGALSRAYPAGLGRLVPART